MDEAHVLGGIMDRFAVFLSASWEAARQAASATERVEAGEIMSDWAQANWELLVETPFRELVGFGNAFLEVYGEGADCNDGSSRVWIPNALPTHRILCQLRAEEQTEDLLTGNPINAANDRIVFDLFAARAGRRWHEEAAPFDCVLGYNDDREVLLSTDRVTFVAEKVTRPSKS